MGNKVFDVMKIVSDAVADEATGMCPACRKLKYSTDPLPSL